VLQTMNSFSHPPRQSQAAAQPDFRRQVEHGVSCSFNAQKPSRKAVHSLRVATLRLQAGVEYWLRAQEPDAPAARAAKRWNKQGRNCGARSIRCGKRMFLWPGLPACAHRQPDLLKANSLAAAVASARSANWSKNSRRRASRGQETYRRH